MDIDYEESELKDWMWQNNVADMMKLDKLRKNLKIHDIELILLWTNTFKKYEYSDEQLADKARQKANEEIVKQLFRRLKERNSENDMGVSMISDHIDLLRLDKEVFKGLMIEQIQDYEEKLDSAENPKH